MPFHDRFLAILRFHDFKIEIRFQSLFEKVLQFRVSCRSVVRNGVKSSVVGFVFLCVVLVGDWVCSDLVLACVLCVCVCDVVARK